MVRHIRSTVLVFFVGVCAAPSLASVVMIGTRVVYPSGAKERSLQFSNPDDVPSVVQIWIDSGEADSTPDTADAPFVVAPPIFRIEPKAGQTVRLIFTGRDLPKNRESVFFINTLQIPAINSADMDRNKMLFLLRNRIKLFYRPDDIPGNAETAFEQLRFSAARDGLDWRITAKNDSAFYISLIEVRIAGPDEDLALAPGMIAPKSTFDWRIKSEKSLASVMRSIHFKFINEHGGENKAELPLDPHP